MTAMQEKFKVNMKIKLNQKNYSFQKIKQIICRKTIKKKKMKFKIYELKYKELNIKDKFHFIFLGR